MALSLPHGNTIDEMAASSSAAQVAVNLSPTSSTTSSTQTAVSGNGLTDEPSNSTQRAMHDLDQLENRLERFTKPSSSSSSNGGSHLVPPVPSLRKNSAGSHIPKPEISAKPAFFVSASNYMSQSLRSPTKAKLPPKEVSKDTSIAAKASGTASMLKSTLRRMTRLSINPSKETVSSNSSPEESPMAPPRSSSRRVSPKRQQNQGASINRSRSFKEPAPSGLLPRNNSQTGLSQRGTLLSNSLRRPRNKDRSSIGSTTSEDRPAFQRSGTGGTLEGRRTSVNRSHSVTNRRFKDRDLNIKKSRAIQTQLTRDTFNDSAEDMTDAGVPTQVDFSLYMPDLLGIDDDAVESHVSEPTEPVDVRKNRQLTLDNMKLHREVERYKSQVTENDSLKKELRLVKAKLEEEQKTRTKIEQQLDQHNEKVKMIVQSMDCVEKEFECRDGNIYALEKRLEDSKHVISQLQYNLDSSNEMMAALKLDLDKSLAAQKTLLQQYQDAEDESQELQEFLQAEKMTLAETLKDCEAEIAGLKAKLVQKDVDISGVEERCGHLVRLGEQRHQEVMALEAELTRTQEKAKEMLLAQGAEISRANIHVSELYLQLEKLIQDSVGFPFPLASTSGPNSDIMVQSVPNNKSFRTTGETAAFPGSSCEDSSSLANSEPGVSKYDHSQLPSLEKLPRSDSQFLVSVPNDLNSMSKSMFGPSTNNGNSGVISESLQNLSNAITQRQKSENGPDSLESSNSSLPSLVDKISDVQGLIEKYIKIRQCR